MLVLQDLGTDFYPVWHYAVVIGYIPESDRLVLRSGTTLRDTTPADRFMNTWRRAGSWGLIILRPGEMPVTAQSDSYLQAVADLESTGRFGVAALAYGAATRRWPENPTAWFGLGNTQYRLGDPIQARRSYQAAIRADPGYPAAYNNLAEIEAERGCFDAALGSLEAALALPGDAAQRLHGALTATRREILARRPTDYRGDAPTCSPYSQGGGVLQGPWVGVPPSGVL